MRQKTGYIGTYASPDSPGIFRFTIDLDTGHLSDPHLYCRVPDCKYLSLYNGLLAAPVRRDGRCGISLSDTAAAGEPAPAEVFCEESPACFVTQDANLVYTANYHEGSVRIYEKSGKTPRLLRHIEISPKAGCHQVILHGRYMLIPCLLLNRVNIYDRDQDFALAGSLEFPPGTGPRHGTIDNDFHLFLVSELSNELFVYDWQNGPLPTLRAQLPVLPAGFTSAKPPASAAIRLSPDERFLYVSTRFADVITVFELENSSNGILPRAVQQLGSGGVHPRDIVLTPGGEFLLAANRTDGSLVSFRRDPGSGKLSDPISRVPAPEAVSVVLEP